MSSHPRILSLRSASRQPERAAPAPAPQPIPPPPSIDPQLNRMVDSAVHARIKEERARLSRLVDSVVHARFKEEFEVQIKRRREFRESMALAACIVLALSVLYNLWIR